MQVRLPYGEGRCRESNRRRINAEKPQTSRPKLQAASAPFYLKQAVDLWFLAVTIVEKRYVDAENLSNLLEKRRADPVDARFAFLHLLKGEAEFMGQLCLRDTYFPATLTDSPSDLVVRGPGRSWAALG
jgi:hypothetical protein